MTYDCTGKSVAVGEVVQILVGTRDNIFDGCFAVVDEIKKWGIIADVYGVKGETYPIRLASNQFKWIGRAAATRDQ
jgi:hypothetical protein